MEPQTGLSPLEEAREELLRESERLAGTPGRGNAEAEAVAPRSFLIFSLGAEEYAVDLSAVRKVLRPGPIARVSGAGPEVLGLMNCQGEVLCVLDLRRILSRAKDEGGVVPASGKFVVVLRHGVKEAGFLVNEVRDVSELPAASVLPVLDSVDPSRSRLFEGTLSCAGRFVGLLSLSACLNP